MSDERERRAAPSEPERVLSVHEVNSLARGVIERILPGIWIEGEVVEVSLASRVGNVFFTLGDARAHLRCVMYQGDVVPLARKLERGMKLRARGRLTLFVRNGSFQLAVTELVEAGAGDRAARRAALEKKLEEEGLLDPARRRPLPRYPVTVGVVTSRDGQAWHDVLRVTRGRFPSRIVLAHTLVQGPDAPEQIVRAITAIQRLRNLSVILVVRGGGANEDLEAFDDEAVARAIAAARVPVITGVGHERNVSVADLVADASAATPSHAAELSLPPMSVVRRELDERLRALRRAVDRVVVEHRLVLERRTRALTDPRALLRAPRARLLELERRATSAIRRRLGEEEARLRALDERRIALDPRARVAKDRANLTALDARLARAMERRMTHARAALASHARALDALSPLSVLDRGYAIATLEASGEAVRDAREAPPGTRLLVRVARGTLRADVIESDPRPGG